MSRIFSRPDAGTRRPTGLLVVVLETAHERLAQTQVLRQHGLLFLHDVVSRAHRPRHAACHLHLHSVVKCNGGPTLRPGWHNPFHEIVARPPTLAALDTLWSIDSQKT